jgi:23S rRNA (cytidine1920-2'-O)/16S rRNA (cytidine1409-2'-O)-methyltransferase
LEVNLAAQGGGGKARKRRVDEILVERGLAETVERARALVLAGKVVAGDQRVDKPSQLVAPDTPVRVKDESRFVSRGGDKLHAALEDFGLLAAVRGKTVLDVGASTGGFTDCCLHLGAAHVIALDVGTAQLAWELRQDARVTVLEKTDVRDFDPGAHPPVAFVVADVSFNSLARLAPALRAAAPGAGVTFVLLVKPQFELPRAAIPDGGVVVDEAMRQAAAAAVVEALAAAGLSGARTVDARVAGRAGNREIFLCVVAPG